MLTYWLALNKIETLDDMQRSLSIKDSEYQETLNRISEDKVELQVQLEKSSVQITQLKAEQKRAEELLSKAGLVGAPRASGHDLGPVSSPLCLSIFSLCSVFRKASHSQSHILSIAIIAGNFVTYCGYCWTLSNSRTVSHSSCKSNIIVCGGARRAFRAA